MLKKYTAGLSLVGIACLYMQPASAETVIGRWCDKMVPNLPQFNSVMTIMITDEGKVELRLKFNDGSATEVELMEAAGGVYETVGDSGDKYRIVPNTGNLQLLDDDGLISIATRLENTPQSEECSR